MTDYLKEEMRRTAAAKSPDKKTARLALHFCQQAFQITDARIVDDRYIIAANLDFDFTDELAVIGVINQMCDAYGLSMDIAINPDQTPLRQQPHPPPGDLPRRHLRTRDLCGSGIPGGGQSSGPAYATNGTHATTPIRDSRMLRHGPISR
jgi:hypothetical protein